MIYYTIRQQIKYNGTQLKHMYKIYGGTDYINVETYNKTNKKSENTAEYARNE